MRIDFDQIKRDVTDRWYGVFASLGIDVGDGRHTTCPVCGGKNKFRCDDKNGCGTWICTCGNGDGWKLLQEVLNCNFVDAVKQVAPILGMVENKPRPKEPTVDNRDNLRKMWLASKELRNGDLAWHYLQSRGLNLFPPNLRYTTRCYESETKKEMPAMLASVMSHDDQFLTFHRTYLDPKSATKAVIESPKKLMPAIRKVSSSAIRLFELNGEEMGVAEGIETAIACTQKFKIPTWATVCSSIMQNFIPPDGIKKIYIFGDNDINYTGHKASYILANNLMLKYKKEVEVIIPDNLGDWLDNINN